MVQSVTEGLVDDRWLDQARASLGSSCRRWRAMVQDLEGLGRVPGRCFFNDKIVLASTSGDYYGSLTPSCYGASPSLGGGGVSHCRSWKGKVLGTCLLIFRALSPFIYRKDKRTGIWLVIVQIVGSTDLLLSLVMSINFLKLKLGHPWKSCYLWAVD